MARKAQAIEAKQEVNESGLRAKMLALIASIRQAMLERDEEALMLGLVLLARLNAFLLGPPGTGKSMIMEAFAGAIKDAKFFGTLCMKTSPPEQFFGPLSVKGLLEDRFERNIDGYLPACNIAFLDEVWKCNAAVLNGNLRIMNERKFKNGTKDIDVPLISALGASNEMPQEDDLGALYDRFSVRMDVQYLADQSNVVKLLTQPNVPVAATITLAELRAMHVEVDAVRIPEAVAAKAAELRVLAVEQAMKCSDRRLKQAMGLVRANAWLNGRSEANISDLAVLCSVLWDSVQQKPKAYDIVMDAVNPLARKGRDILAAIRSVVHEVEKAKPEDQMDIATNGIPKINEAVGQLKRIIKESKADGHDVSGLEAQLKRAQGESRALYEKYVGKNMAHIMEDDD